MQATHPCVGDLALIKRTLASVPLFEDWPPIAFAELCDGSKIIRYDLNETVIQQGVVLQGLYAIASGCVEICSLHVEGQRYVRRFAEPGLIFGLMSMFDGEGAPHLYLAHLPTQLVFVPKLTLLPILSRNDQLWLSIVRQMAAYQRQFLSSMEDGLFQTLRVRLARAVVSLTRAYGTKAVGQQTIRIRLTQEDLGALLGVTRQSISKELRLLELEGVLRVGYGKLMVTDQDALGRVADEPATGGVLT